MTAAKVMDIIARLLWRTSSSRYIGIHPKEEDAKQLTIPKSECPDVWIRLPRHKWPESWEYIEEPVVPLERNFFGQPLAGLWWERQFDKALMDPGWAKYQIGNAYSFTENKLSPMWKKLMKDVDLEEPTSRDSQLWPRKNEKSGWFSVQQASWNQEKSSEDSGGLAETHASCNGEYSRKVVQDINDRLGHDEKISEKKHMSIWTRFMVSSMQAALHMDLSYGKNLKVFKNSQFENKSLFGNTRMMTERNLECISRSRCEFTLGKLVLLEEQTLKWTKARVFVHSDFVLCMGKQHGPEDAIKWSDQVCFTFRELRRLDGDPIDFEWKVFPRAQAFDNSPQNWKQILKERTSHLKNSVVEKFHDNVQWHWTGKQR